jgi:Rap1a immunity proteins
MLRFVLLLVLSLVVSLGLAQPCVANFLDGNELRARCESDRPETINTCLGYLTGIADAEHAAPSWRMAPSLFCIPQGIDSGQMRRVVLRYFTQHPEEEDFNAAIVVGNAFLEAFPCD